MKGEKTKINQLKQQGRRGDNSNKRENNVNQYDDDPDNVGSNNANPKQYKQTFKKKASVQRKKKKTKFFFLYLFPNTHLCLSTKSQIFSLPINAGQSFFFSFFSFSPPFPAEIHRDQQFCLFTYLWFKTASFYLRAFLPTKCHFLCIGACIKNIAWMTVI